MARSTDARCAISTEEELHAKLAEQRRAVQNCASWRDNTGIWIATAGSVRCDNEIARIYTVMLERELGISPCSRIPASR